MAAFSGDDIPTQLGALLGREIARIRITDQTPPKVSVIDVVQAVVTGSGALRSGSEFSNPSATSAKIPNRMSCAGKVRSRTSLEIFPHNRAFGSYTWMV